MTPRTKTAPKITTKRTTQKLNILKEKRYCMFFSNSNALRNVQKRDCIKSKFYNSIFTINYWKCESLKTKDLGLCAINSHLAVRFFYPNHVVCSFLKEELESP